MHTFLTGRGVTGDIGEAVTGAIVLTGRGATMTGACWMMTGAIGGSAKGDLTGAIGGGESAKSDSTKSKLLA